MAGESNHSSDFKNLAEYRHCIRIMTMNQVANLIHTKLPNYACIADCEFNKLYNHQWNESRYINWDMNQNNHPFDSLKRRYVKVPLTRTMIIDLFKSGNYQDGFLCAMIWGGIGVHNRNNTLDSIFSGKAQQCVNAAVSLLQQGKIQDAYNLLLKGVNHIEYVGESFFTKLLYFAGASITNPPLNPLPLIFDNVLKGVYGKIKGYAPKNNAVATYLSYCSDMETLRQLLNLPTAGHVEALLFSPGI